MTLTELRDTVESRIQVEEETKILLLDETVLPERLAVGLVSSLARGRRLIIADTEVEENADALTLSGAARVLGLDDMPISIAFSNGAGPLTAEVSCSLKQDGSGTGAWDWLQWETLEIRLTATDGDDRPTGAISGRLGPSLDFSGELSFLPEDDDQELQPRWTLHHTPVDGQPLTLRQLMPPEGRNLALDILKRDNPDLESSQAPKIDIQIDALPDGSVSHALRMSTGADYELVSGLTISELGLTIRSTIMAESGATASLELDGVASLGESGRALDFASTVTLGYAGLEYGFELGTRDGTLITLADILGVLAPDAEITLPESETFAGNILDSGLSRIQVQFAPSESAMSLYAEGSLMSLEGSLWLRTSMLMGQPLASFELHCFEDAMPIGDVIQKTLGLRIPEPISQYLPSVGLAVQEIKFDQMDSALEVSGIVEQDGAEFETSARVGWADGLNLEFSLHSNDEGALGLTALAPGLEPAVDFLGSVTSPAIADKLKATSVQAFGLELDTSELRIALSGLFNLFGVLLVDGQLDVTLEGGQPVIRLEAALESEEMSIGQALEYAGIESASDWTPGVQVGLEHILLDGHQRLYSVTGVVSGASGALGVTLEADLSGDTQLRMAVEPRDEGAILTVRDSLGNALSQQINDIPLPAKFSERVLSSGISGMDISLAPSDGELAIYAEGAILGFEGSVWFRLSRLMDQPFVSFEVLCSNEADTISNILTERVGLDFAADLAPYLPSARLALEQVAFDQMYGAVSVKGTVEQDGVVLEAEALVQIGDDLRVELSLDATSGEPLTLGYLSESVGLPLDGDNVLAQKLAATEFHSIGVTLDSGEKSLHVEGIVNLLGEALVDASLDASVADGSPAWHLQATVMHDPVSLKDLLMWMGLEAPEGVVPEISLALESVDFDQAQGNYTIQGVVEVGGGRATVALGVQTQDGGPVATLDITSDPENPPQLVAPVGAAMSAINADSLPVPDVTTGLDSLHLRYESATHTLTGSGAGFIEAGGLAFDMKIERPTADDSWTAIGGLREAAQFAPVDLFRKLAPGAPELPEILPSMEVSELSLGITPQTGAFRFAAVTSIDWQIMDGADGVTTAFALSVGRGWPDDSDSEQTDGAVSLTLEARLEGSISIFEDARFDGGTVGFRLDGSDWAAYGTARAHVLGDDYSLDVSGSAGDGAYSLDFTLERDSADELLVVRGLGAVNFTCLSLSLTRANGAYSWEVAAEGGARLDGVFDLQGATRLFDNVGGKSGLSFTPTEAVARIPLPIPYPQLGPVTLDLELGNVSITRTAGQSSGAWSFEASGSMSLPALYELLPSEVRSVLGERMTIALEASSSSGVSIRVTELIKPQDITLPDIALEGTHHTIPLGTIRFELSSIGVTFSDRRAALSLELGVGLPSSMNNIFGAQIKDGQEVPLVRIFKTFDSNDSDSVVRTRISLGTDGLSVALASSPFEFFEFEDEDDQVWIKCDFGEYGEIRIQSPEFALDPSTLSFKASGGFEVTRDLSLPVGLVKPLLEQFGLQLISENLPDALPIKPPPILDENDQFNADEALALVRKYMGDELAQAIEEPVRFLAYNFNRLPDTMRPYLQPDFPTSFLFEIAVTPDGGVRFRIGVKDGHPPIRLIFPNSGPLGLPVIQGIELHSITLGEVLAGTLILLEVDFRTDTFDPLEVVAAMALENNKVLALSPPRALKQRLIVDRLLMVIVYEAGVPIPIPLFFNELGVEYNGILGLEVQSHVGFPLPPLSPMAALKALADFVSFATDPDAELDPTVLRDKEPHLSLGPNFIRLPEYMGGDVIGDIQRTQLPGAYEIAANILNVLKKVTFNDLVTLFPIDYRAGSESLTFMGFTVEGNWLLVTPGEFSEFGYGRLGISGAGQEAARNILPDSAQTGHDEQGLVLFLRGRTDIEGIASLESYFALAASGLMGFHTGFRFAGQFLDLLDVELAGRINVDTQEAQKALPDAPESGFLMSGGSDYVQLPPLRADFSEGMTVELWVNFNQFSGWTGVLDLGNGVHVDNILLLANEGKLEFDIDPDYFQVDTDLSLGTWIHIAVSVEPDGTSRVYKNGELIREHKLASGPPSVLRSENYVGRDSWNDHLHVDGQVGEIRVWSRPIAQDAIKSRMNVGLLGTEPGLVGYWRPSGAQGADKLALTWRSQAEIHGATWPEEQLEEGPTFLSGAMFNGQNSRIDLGAGPIASDGFTIEAWVNLDEENFDGWNMFFNNNQLFLRKDSSSEGGRLSVFAKTSDGALESRASSQTVPTPGSWLHVAGAWDGQTLRLYYNGVLEGESSRQGVLNADSIHAWIGSGQETNPNWGPMAGKIAEVRLWNRPRSQSEIQETMNGPLKGAEEGLEGYWPLREGIGDQTYDMAGNNHGTLNNCRWVLPSQFEPEGLHFDGIDDYVDLGADVPISGPFTIEAWVKGSEGTIFQRDRNNLRSGHVELDFNNYFQVFGADGNSSYLSYSGIPANQWAHIAATSDGSSMRVFVNGELVGSKEVSGIPGPSDAASVLGKRQNETQGSKFKGEMAEVRLWGTARSQNEIRADMRHHLAGTERGLVGYWPLVERQGRTVFDLAGHSNGRIFGAAWSDIETPNEGLVFDGVDDYVDLGSGLPISSGFTVEAWVNGAEGAIFQRDGANLNSGHIEFDFNNYFQVTTTDGNHQYLSYSCIALNQWNHMAASCDGSALRVFMNGRQVASKDIEGVVGPSMARSVLGKRQTDAQGAKFNGRMARVRVWNVARSEAEIADNMSRPLAGNEAGLIGYWPMSENIGDTIYNLTTGRNGILQGPRWAEPSELDLAGLKFDGSDDFVDLGVGVPVSRRFTIEAWVNGTHGTIFQRDADLLRAGHIELDFNNWFQFTDTQGVSHAIIYSAIPIGEWAHVAATHDGSTMRIFVNGELVESREAIGAPGPSDASSAIGKRQDDAHESKFSGQIAEVRLWDVARTRDEITSNMDRPLTGREDGLVGYWPMNARVGNRVFDHVGSNNGIIQGATWPEPPNEEGEGIVFDGINDYVDAGPLRSPEDSAWSVEVRFKWDGQNGFHTLYAKEGLFKAAVLNGYFAYAWQPNSQFDGAGNAIPITPGEWYHVTVTYDGQRQVVYDHGREVYSREQAGPVGSSDVRFLIGAEGGGSPRNFFRGNIHYVRVWDRALTPPEILSNTHRRLKGSEEGLVAGWRFEPDQPGGVRNLAGRELAVWDGAELASSPPRGLALKEALFQLNSIADIPSDAGVSVFGHAHLDILGDRIFEADVRLINDLFLFAGTVDLFPRVSTDVMRVYGDVRGWIDSTGLDIRGSVEVSLVGVILAGGNLRIANDGFWLDVTYIGQTAQLQVTKHGEHDVRFYGGLVEAIRLGDVFHLSATSDITSPDYNRGPYLEAIGPINPSFQMHGAMSVPIFQLAGEVHITVTGAAFDANATGNFFGIFDSSIHVWGANLERLEEFSFQVTFNNGLKELETEVFNRLNQASRNAENDVATARQSIENAQLDYNAALNAEINRLRGEAQRRQDAARGGMTDADRTLEHWQNEVRRLDTDIENARETVRNEQAGARRDLSNAQAEVSRWQRDVDSLEDEIRRTESWYYDLPAVNWPWNASQAREAVYFAGKVATLWSAHKVPWGFLEIAKGVLEGLKWANDLRPVDLDPRVSTLILAKEGAVGSLEVARLAVGTARGAFDSLPGWVRDGLTTPELIATEAANIVGAGGLELARQTLQTTEDTFSGIRAIGDWISQNGGVMPLNVTHAEFGGALSTVSGAAFTLSMDIEFTNIFGQRENRHIGFLVDFTDIPGAAARMVTEVYPQMALPRL